MGERRREFAVMAAVSATRREIAAFVWSEAALILGAAVCFLGGLALIGASYYLYAPSASCSLNLFFITWSIVVGGALGAQTLNADGIKALAELPSLNELRAGLIGMISTPATRIAGILQAPAGQLARVFGAYARRDEVEAEAA